MRTLTTTELERMDVINLCDGARLGCPSSLEICPEDGKVTALFIPLESGFFSFGRSETYRIPWCRVECLGEDTVLVKLTAAELAGCVCKKGKHG